MKKHLFLILALSVVLVLAACGQSENNAQTAESTEAAISTDESSAAAAEAQSEETTSEETTEAQTEAETPVQAEYAYGTATLTFAEFYAGDVSSTDNYDVVSSATNSKYSIMPNIASDFVDEETNADGYHLTGVQNVYVAVPEDDIAAYQEINPTFVQIDAEPAQYKPVNIKDGKAQYFATVFNVAETITDATAELLTGSVWGDYQINVTDPEGKTYLRNTREDEGFLINGNIQGIIIETESGLKVGMEFLQSIWVQPYEVSWNVSADNTHNVHIADWDNMAELDKLVGENVISITYIMPDSTYVYTFDGIYVKPVYDGSAEIKAEFTEGSAEVSVSGIPSDLDNPTVTVVMGSGRGSVTVADAVAADNGSVTMKDENGAELAYDPEQVYKVTVNSDNYAGIVAAIPIRESEIAQLNDLIAKAQTVLASNDDAGVKEHMEEAQELIAGSGATSGEAQELISELTSHLSVYEAAN